MVVVRRLLKPTSNGGTTPEIATFTDPSVILALIGLIILVLLVVSNVPGAFLISVFVTTLIGIPMGVTTSILVACHHLLQHSMTLVQFSDKH